MTEAFSHTRDAILLSLKECARVEPALRDAADIIFVRYILAHDQNGPEISHFLAEFEAAQNPHTGALPHLHTFGMSLRALNMVHATPTVPFRFLHAWRQSGAMVKFIRGLDWSNPWQSSIEVLHALTPIALEGEVELRDAMITLESFQSADGGWGSHSDPHHRLAAAFHFIPIYEAIKQTPPRLDKLARTAAAFHFHSLSGFLAMDTAYVLRYALIKGAIAYKETEALFARLEELIVSSNIDLRDRHSHVAAAQLLFVLSDLRGERGYRDAWDSRLWRLPQIS